MYNRNLSENGSDEGSASGFNNESKYVADILSSMANGEPAAPSYHVPDYMNMHYFHPQYTLPGYATSGVTTGTTPTLTPTTLANIEQTFIELQSVPVNTGAHDHLTQGGFVPPIVDPISGSDRTPGGTPDHYDYSDSDDSEWIPSEKLSRDNSGTSVVAGSRNYSISRGRKQARRDLDDLPLNCSPEEEDRRRVRRERNKVAAAKCRQRRVDQTNRLVTETDKLEDEKANLESEIQTLQQHKDQLEFILQAHQPLCKTDGLLHAHGAENGINARVKSEFQQRRCAGTDADQSTNGGTAPLRLPTIKQEISEYRKYNSNCALKSDLNSMHASSRPSTLPLVSKGMSVRTSQHPVSVATATGISITTPSSGFFSFSGLEMADGHTGLTPLGGPSCASQIQRNSTDSSPDGMASPTLLSL